VGKTCPKSIARENVRGISFIRDYIKLTNWQRAEGVRWPSEQRVKVLAQTVPDAAKNDQIRAIEIYLSTMIRAGATPLA